MAPSRRQLLRTGILSLAGLSGCATGRWPSGGAGPEATPTPDPSPGEPAPSTVTPVEDGTIAACGTDPTPAAPWPLPDRSAGRANYAPAADGPTAAPTAAWSVTAPRREVGKYQYTRPVVAGGRVVAGRRHVVGSEREPPDRQAVLAYDLGTGAERWRATVGGEPSPPAVADDHVLVHDGTTLHAVDAASGEPRWTISPPGGIRRALPTPASVLVVSRGENGGDRMRLVEPEGTVRWELDLPGVVGSRIAWSGERAYVATPEAAVIAVDTAEPAVSWTRNLQDDGDTQPTTLVATPCAVYAAADGTLYGLQRTGGLAWVTPGGGRELAADGQAVYGLSGAGYVRAFSAADGTRQWERFVGRHNRLTDGFYVGAAMDAATLFAGALDRKLVAVATADGRVRWTLECDWDAPARVARAGGQLLAGWGRHLVAFQ